MKAKNVTLISKIDENKKDNYFFSEGFFDLEKESFVTKDTKIKIHKDIFGNKENDPRLFGYHHLVTKKNGYKQKKFTVVK